MIEMTSPESAQNDPPPKWAIAALALARGDTFDQAAEAAGVNRRTVYRWRKNPRFAAKVRQIRDEMVSEAAGRLAATITAGINALVKLLDDENPAVRLRAATEIIDSTLRVRNAVDVADRIAALEACCLKGDDDDRQ